MASSHLRFGIIGCGSIGPTHAGAIGQIAGARLVAVADPVEARARAMADQFGVSKVYASDRDLLADPSIDVVCLCTPSGMHADGAVAAGFAEEHATVVPDADAATATLTEQLNPGDVVLVKASRSAGLERVADALLAPAGGP